MPAPAPSRLQARLARPLVVILVLCMLALAYRLGVLERVADPARLRQTLVGLGPWGYVAFVAAYTLLQPFGVPGTVFVVAAPLIWPWPVAFALSLVGTMAASVLGFSFARFVARDWAARIVPARVRKYDDLLARHAFATVFVLRFVFWMPQWLHAFFGVSKVPASTHFWASLAGYALPLFVMSYFGERLFAWFRAVPTSTWIALLAGLVLVTVVMGLARRRRAPL